MVWLPEIKTSNSVIAVSCLIGIMLSAYAFHVEVSAESDEDYRPMCDISEHMSCTRVFTSAYGKGFGFLGKYVGEDSVFNLPNGSLGIAFYLGIASLCFSNDLDMAKVQLGLSLVSVLTSFYLAYILYFILHDFCIVCVSTYCVNVINCVYTFWKVTKIQIERKQQKELESQ